MPRRSLPVPATTSMIPQDCWLAIPRAWCTAAGESPSTRDAAAAAAKTPKTLDRFQSLRQPTWHRSRAKMS